MNDPSDHRDTAAYRRLERRMRELFAADPGLAPDPQMRDYQVTYPPAIALEQADFEHSPAPEEYAARLAGPLTDAGYYFHFGFCEYRCRYCFHYEIEMRTPEEVMARYVDALLLEAERQRALSPHLRQCLVFLGGGTPTALPERLIHHFLDGFVRIFGALEGRMSTVEAKPVTATRGRLEAFAAAGFRRCSMGVQTFDPALYALHHQREDVALVRPALELAREVGLRWINIDLITGLEGQTQASWEQTLERTRELVEAGLVDSVFIYPYHDDPRSRTFREASRCPEPMDVIHTDAQARAMFERMGWMELGPRFYRSPAHMAAEMEEVQRLGVIPSYGDTLWLGFGNSAYSVGDDCTYLNARDREDYVARVARGGLPIKHWATLDARQKATRDVTFALMYAPFIDVGKARRRYGEESVTAMDPVLRRWADLGLGSYDGDLFFPTSDGKLLHLQMVPMLYDARRDSGLFDGARLRRKAAGRAYRGY